MKLLDSKLSISIGKNKSNHYKVVHIFKEQIDLKEFNFLKEYSESGIFVGDIGQQLFDHSKKVIYLGLGSTTIFNVRKLAAQYVKIGEILQKWKNIGLEINISKEISDKIEPELIVYHVATSIEIGIFPLDSLSATYKERKIEPGPITIDFDKIKINNSISEALEKSRVVSRYLNGARYIEHLPANYFTPIDFESRAKAIAKENKLKVIVFDEEKLKKDKFNGILSVARGSENPPRMIILEYSPKDAVTDKKLVIVGKGLTFDSGGISIKPSAEMHEMKYDMSGAAAAIHAIGAIAALGYKVPVVAAIGVAENMPDGAAIKPGDVYTAYNGVTVEVQNTDAEGRLVLGDVLAYTSEKYSPEYLVDMATLTGAVIVALGHEAAGVMSNSIELSELLQKASTLSEDRIWELPFWEEYSEELKSDIADVKNITGGKGGGTVTASHFLAKFINEKSKWAHIDIAGTAWRSKASGTQCSGPTGYGVRLMVELAKEIEVQNSQKK